MKIISIIFFFLFPKGNSQGITEILPTYVSIYDRGVKHKAHGPKSAHLEVPYGPHDEFLN